MKVPGWGVNSHSEEVEFGISTTHYGISTCLVFKP